MSDALNLWLDLMESRFPMVSADGFFELSFVREGSEANDERLRATIRTIVFGNYDGERSVRDIREQELDAGHIGNLEMLERYGEFLRALAMVIETLHVDVLESLMPSDVFLADVLDLKATNADEFGRSLSAKSRLGEFSDT